MALVLCAGIDPVLIKTRQLILEKAGHTVMAAFNEREIKAACGKQKFDVVVIGQNISPKGRTRALGLIREDCPEVRVLEVILPYGSKALADADAWIEMPCDPEELIKVVNSLAPDKKD